MTPYVKAHGFGDIDPVRMQASIDQVAEALELPRKPAIDEVFTDKFLPPADLRKLP
jgi:NitT/TauT family transport system substrate-binding protein